MRTLFSLFLTFFVTAPSFAAKAANGKPCDERLEVSPKTVQKVLGYPPEILSRLKKHRPQLYAGIVDAAASRDPKKIDRYKAVSAYRGISAPPEDYDAGHANNRFFTRKGEIWFSWDSSVAWNYTDLEEDSAFGSYEEVLEEGHQHWGVMIAVELPKFMTDECYHQRFRDFSILRSDLGNESVFISSVSLKFIKKSGEPVEKILSYKAFKNKFGAKNKTLL